MVVDDVAPFAVENLAPGRQNGRGFNAVPVGRFRVQLVVLHLQLPETGDEKQEDGNAGVLKERYLTGREIRIVVQDSRVELVLIERVVGVRGHAASLASLP